MTQTLLLSGQYSLNNENFFKHRLSILILTNLRDKVDKNIYKYCLVQKGPKNI